MKKLLSILKPFFERMNTQESLLNSHCCCCGADLTNSPSLNLIQVDLKAKWPDPTWGNVLTGGAGMACAFLCDGCYEKGQQVKGNALLPVQNVIEFDGRGNIIYHEVEIIDGSYTLKKAHQ